MAFVLLILSMQVIAVALILFLVTGRGWLLASLALVFYWDFASREELFEWLRRPQPIRDALNALRSRRKYYVSALALVLLLIFSARFGIPGLNTWRADNSAHAACNDVKRVRANLPTPFIFGTDYTKDFVYPKLTYAVLNALSDALKADGADTKHYMYLLYEVTLLYNNLNGQVHPLPLPFYYEPKDGTADPSEIHAPKNILELNLLPFCAALAYR